MKLFKFTVVGIIVSIIAYFVCTVILVVSLGYFAIKGGEYIQQHGLKSVCEKVWEGDRNE